MEASSIKFSLGRAPLNRNAAGQRIEELSNPENSWAQAVAEVMQRSPSHI